MNNAEIKILLADAEAGPRAHLHTLLSLEPDVLVMGECQDGFEALRAIARSAPDLVFLDVELPLIDGFGVMSALFPHLRPRVVFTSRTTSDAVRAFEVNALDYLVKPINDDRLRQAMMRMRDFMQLPVHWPESLSQYAHHAAS